jgi:drug/metabolite transporter (DMT)-like permease
MTKLFMLLCVVVSMVALGERPAHAQGRDSLWNGAVIGAAVGAGAGIAFTHAVRDSDLTFSQYARGALIFGAMGAGIGLGIDALLDRSPRTGPTPPRVLISPTIWRDVAGVRVRWRW